MITKILIVIISIFILSSCYYNSSNIKYRVGQKFNYDSLIQASPNIKIKLDYQDKYRSSYYIRGYGSDDIWLEVENDSTITKIYKY